MKVKISLRSSEVFTTGILTPEANTFEEFDSAAKAENQAERRIHDYLNSERERTGLKVFEISVAFLFLRDEMQFYSSSTERYSIQVTSKGTKVPSNYMARGKNKVLRLSLWTS